MKETVKILYEGSESEITEKKSRFIATARPVRTEEEASAFIDEIRKKYFDARHNPYAYVIGDDGNTSRLSDDGEPSQTAGLPILNVIRNSGVVNACIVVTRYFGGTLLGTGGLFRAYTKAAREALDAGVIVEKRLAERWKVTAEYTDIGKIQNMAQKEGFFLLDGSYTDKAELTLLVPLSEAAGTGRKLTEITAARAKIYRSDMVPYALLNGKTIIFDDESLAIPKD